MSNRILPVITESDQELPFYLLDAGFNWEQEPVRRPSGYHYQWIQCVEGEGELRTGEKSFRLTEGTGMLLLNGEFHEYYAVSSSWLVDWAVFDGFGVEPFLKHNAGMAASGGYYLSKPEKTRARMYELLEAAHMGEALKGFTYSGIIYSLLTDIAQYASLSPNSSLQNRSLRLSPLFRYINENFARPMTLEELAGIAGVTPEYLCTVFKKNTNVRLFQYINSVRVQKSKELLLHCPQMPVRNIARLCGFEDPNYFCSVFKKLVRLSPSRYRDLNH